MTQPHFATPPGLSTVREPVGYSRIYGPMAVLAFCLTFTDMFEDVVDSEDFRRTYGSLWELAGDHSGAPAMVGILLMFALVGVLLAATFRAARGPALPIAIAAISAIAIIMIITRPGTGDPAPELADGGAMMAALAAFALAASIAHIVHLTVLARRARATRAAWAAHSPGYTTPN